MPHWGGAATGVEYEARANRLWVAGGPTGTVRVYDASSGDLLRQYTFSPAGFLNDLVVTRDAVYVTDSFNAWLDVIPLGRRREPSWDRGRHDPAVDGDRVRARPIQRERDRRDAQLSDRRRLVHRRPLPRQQEDRGRDTDLDRRRQRRQRGRIGAARQHPVRRPQRGAGPGLPTRRPAGVGGPARDPHLVRARACRQRLPCRLAACGSSTLASASRRPSITSPVSRRGRRRRATRARTRGGRSPTRRSACP